VIRQSAPEEMADFEKSLAAAKAEIGVDIEKDLIATLGNEWINYRGPTGTHPFVLVHKLKDAATFSKTLEILAEKVNAAAGGKFQVEKLDAGTMEVTGIRLPQITIAWTVRGDYFYASTLEGITSAVEQVEKKGDPITLNPDFVKVLAALPQQKWMSLTYSEPATLYPGLYGAAMGLSAVARMRGLDLPGDLLPNPDRVAPFMPPGGSVSWMDADGLHMMGRSAFPGAGIVSGEVSAPMAVGVAAMGTAILLPSLAKSRELAGRSLDAANLRGICNSAVIYSAEHNDALPDHVGRLLLEGMGPKLLVSKRSGTKPLEMTDELKKLGETDFDAFCKKVDEHCDFVYLGKGMKSETDASIVLAFEKPGAWNHDGINLAFQDVHVEYTKWKSVPDVLKTTNEYLKKNNLTEVDIDALMKQVSK
jgi:hypothetical protein